MKEAILYYKKKLSFPIEMVFTAFSDPKNFGDWFGPKQARVIDVKMDFKIGGSYSVKFKKDNGVEFSIYGIYKEILKPSRIVITFNYEGIPQTFGHSVVYFDFIPDKENTEIALRQNFSAMPADIDGRTASWEHMFNCLTELLSGLLKGSYLN